jgi:hypothetical protein
MDAGEVRNDVPLAFAAPPTNEHIHEPLHSALEFPRWLATVTRTSSGEDKAVFRVSDNEAQRELRGGRCQGFGRGVSARPVQALEPVDGTMMVARVVDTR